MRMIYQYINLYTLHVDLHHHHIIIIIKAYKSLCMFPPKYNKKFRKKNIQASCIELAGPIFPLGA